MPSTATLAPTVRDEIIRGATSFQSLAQVAQVSDPTLYNHLMGQVTSATTTQGGAIILGIISYLATKYSLPLSHDFDAMVAAAVTLGGGYLLHWLQLRLGGFGANISPVAGNAASSSTIQSIPNEGAKV